jgi:hypothetical protein
MWSIVEREVNKHPLDTLASLKVMSFVVMVNIDRKVVIPDCKKV